MGGACPRLPRFNDGMPGLARRYPERQDCWHMLATMRNQHIAAPSVNRMTRTLGNGCAAIRASTQANSTAR